MRIFIPDITDKHFLLVVPTLEVASRQLKQVLRWRVGKHSDIFFSDVADRLVVGAVRNKKSVRFGRNVQTSNVENLHNVVKGLFPSLWQIVNSHLMDPTILSATT